ncbi:hypothetical protein [Mycoplasmopsis gallopavonis]|uniref:Uncharacterized protein n=1 Tax=Mycoplasmopsis gallopavonis TaxID=76629 RepID=A0A449AZB9_9BACT|nr:hypothetical protein [Mycoplasmopsis gallopavonis]RIV16354.1 hypothetical protein D1113_02680 [Mycoplasmopsis gallopavonis]VEU72878.1 Uncharacterised protein [Mycoplasmopsis gallopavonis]
MKFQINEINWPKNEQGELIKPQTKEEKKRWKQEFNMSSLLSFSPSVSIVFYQRFLKYTNLLKLILILSGALIALGLSLNNFINAKEMIWIRIAFVVLGLIFLSIFGLFFYKLIKKEFFKVKNLKDLFKDMQSGIKSKETDQPEFIEFSNLELNNKMEIQAQKNINKMLIISNLFVFFGTFLFTIGICIGFVSKFAETPYLWFGIDLHEFNYLFIPFILFAFSLGSIILQLGYDLTLKRRDYLVKSTELTVSFLISPLKKELIDTTWMLWYLSNDDPKNITNLYNHLNSKKLINYLQK